MREPVGETVSFDDVEKWLNRSAEVLYMQKDLLLHLFRPVSNIFDISVVSSVLSALIINEPFSILGRESLL